MSRRLVRRNITTASVTILFRSFLHDRTFARQGSSTLFMKKFFTFLVAHRRRAAVARRPWVRSWRIDGRRRLAIPRVGLAGIGIRRHRRGAAAPPRRCIGVGGIGGGSSSGGGFCEAAGAGAPSPVSIFMFSAVLGTVLRRRRARS
jgi:hypothetical protein